MKQIAVVLIFLLHLGLSIGLYSLPSTPVQITVPGLAECEQNKYGGYEEDCIDRRVTAMKEYERRHPLKPDYRRRDLAIVLLGLLAGIGYRTFAGFNRTSLALLVMAYVIPVLLGLVAVLAGLGLIMGFLSLHVLLLFRMRNTGQSHGVL